MKRWRPARTPLGDYDCAELAPTGYVPIFVSGTSSEALHVTPGYAFDIPAGSVLVMQIRLLIPVASNPIPRGTSGNAEMCSTLLWRADANAAKFCACVNGIQLCL